ncbi:MAG: thaumarchaeosortase [Thaumarchaeota archaeon]|nr:MAG: thaumarchaeosortase [Thaumarchaeota archaeon 13_1_40CM_3_38_6]OLD30621.1 MAG: thaumarchaeosortase [Thaumarchaeota archaeon 13_1_40CM_2_39_7]OLE40122.1 MAG: thaumarchaeosortase [Thaumarchaeota archaeon 13_1_20CM_2_38_5]TLY07693.1 MAG: thaumarchaeosortase [Nitrososphaerota archaeon]
MLQNKSTIIALAIIASPILFALVAFPDTFSLGWNQGRGGFLFAMAFIAAELFGLKLEIPKKRLIPIIPLAGLVIAYLTAREFGLKDYLISMAPNYHIQLVDSWTWMWDFIVIAAFFVASMTILFGKRWIRIAPAGPIYAGGTAIILSLDAFFPYDSLGPLQYVVPYLVKLDVSLINLFHLGVASAHNNIMFLIGDHGPFALQVFWPSAGVHSIIIYSLVMMAFLLKMNIARNRKAAYFALGVIGTIGVNVIRIFSLSLFVLKVSTNVNEFESFHGIAGEIMFLPWLFIFLLVVTYVETRHLKKNEIAKHAFDKNQ